MESIIPSLVKTLSTTIAKKLIDEIFNPNSENRNDKYDESIQPELLGHLNETVIWCERNEFYGLSKALSISNSTIGLDISMTPRKFSGKNQSRDIDENELFSLEGHYILLGDPGSGKTTTVKRLCKKLLTEESYSENDIYQYPVVICFRRINKERTLFTEIAHQLGLKWKKVRSSSGEIELRVGKHLLEEAISIALNKTNAILFLDGLDEAHSDKRNEFEFEIKTLAKTLHEAKIILTTRSGDFSKNIEGMDVLEISPLTVNQIFEISKRWLDDSEDFLKLVDKLPYIDTLTRPLSLIQVMVLYKNCGYLLEQPSWMYGKLISLYLEEWDHQNDVQRKTKYSYFAQDRKKEFLAALAFNLTYHSHYSSISFSSADLERAYLKINSSFGLPSNEAKSVIKEIESHTGIFLQAGPNEFEFAHLTYQEYLTAYYLVRDPFIHNIGTYLSRYPAPVAVAVVLASDSVNWLVNIFLKSDIILNEMQDLPHKISIFLHRLNIEKPNFNIGGMLGLVFIELATKYFQNDAVNHELSILALNPSVRDSIKYAVRGYEITKSNDNRNIFILNSKQKVILQNNIEKPKGGKMRSHLISGIVEIPTCA